MKNYFLNDDIKIFCVTAKSFPEGIMEAFTTLEKMLPTINGRIFYGISYKNKDGSIGYKAAVAESFEGEGEKYNCETFIITRGEYLTETIMNWRNNIPAIGSAFQMLLSDPRLDNSFPCVEWYKSDVEVMCMVRINATDN